MFPRLLALVMLERWEMNCMGKAGFESGAVSAPKLLNQGTAEETEDAMGHLRENRTVPRLRTTVPIPRH